MFNILFLGTYRFEFNAAKIKNQSESITFDDVRHYLEKFSISRLRNA